MIFEWSGETYNQQNAMKTMKIDASTQRSIIRLVLGILYLGNLTFTENAKEEAKVTNRDGNLNAFALSSFLLFLLLLVVLLLLLHWQEMEELMVIRVKSVKHLCQNPASDS